MIPRYSRPEMVRIWEPENKFRIWFEIEAHACDAQAELGVILRDAAKAVWERGDKPYTPERAARITRRAKSRSRGILTTPEGQGPARVSQDAGSS